MLAEFWPFLEEYQNFQKEAELVDSAGLEKGGNFM